MKLWNQLPYFLIFSLVFYPISLISATKNFTQCLNEVRSGLWGPLAGVDNYGRVVAFETATAIPYEMCVEACGGGSQPFTWSDFSSEFSAWLLPWLALLSQLPFGANDNLENFLSVVLAIGSPVLAAYSAALTVLNSRWIARRFSKSDYPNTYQAVRSLSSLQQAPIELDTSQSLLASLVVLHENDAWWKELHENLNYTHTWSISAATSIGWVLIAYIFTVIDSLSNVLQGVEVNGQAVGSLWLWLLPVVVAWLQISPKCDKVRVTAAIDRANMHAYVASAEGDPKLARKVSNHRGIFLQQDDGALYNDERCTSPIYNYSRVFSWAAAVEEIAAYFREASRRAGLQQPVATDTDWEPENRYISIHELNRRGSSFEVVAYCTSFLPRRSRWGPGVWGRMIVASLMALLLQWGTAGAAIFVVWETPTRGLGCRSGSYLIYAFFSSVIWAILVASSILSHYSTLNFPSQNLRDTERQNSRVETAASLSIALRRLGKVLAAANTAWIVTTCIFQFSAFFDRCYCDSSVIGLGISKAFNVIEFTPDDLTSMRGAWIGGVFMAIISAGIYIGFINIIINPQIPCDPIRE
ncbi:hypothetical protein D9757_008359 [Collybiopsis confluens]|uniref:Uncharacterized protein n=1 Tax=Collybiopsis confluens TaxID=2823264 RepID=A0A8H5HEW1_9AGAR|nr:hypothetical protein D9757_008359 [Collybiopsis confluens]